MEPQEDHNIIDDLEQLFGGNVAVEDPDTIALQSNAGTETFIPAEKTMTVAEALHMAGIEQQPDYEYIVDGVSVSPDEIVSPGTSIYVHTVVEGG